MERKSSLEALAAKAWKPKSTALKVEEESVLLNLETQSSQSLATWELLLLRLLLHPVGSHGSSMVSVQSVYVV